MKLPEKIVKNCHNGVITTKEVESLGFSRTMLGKYVKAGLLNRVGCGIYSSQKDYLDELFTFSKRSDRFIYSHSTALFLLGKSERTPFKHYVSIKSKETLPRFLRDKVECFYVNEAIFNIGRIGIKTQFGNIVPCYDYERTICDFIKNRNRLDYELFIATIKGYITDKDKNLAKLARYAQEMGIEKKLNQILEIAL